MGDGSNHVLRDALLKHLPRERVLQIMEILHAVYRKSDQQPFPYGHRILIPADLSSHIQTVMNLPCVAIEPVPHTRIPQRLMTAVPNSSFINRVKQHLYHQIRTNLDQPTRNTIEYDFMQGFGYQPLKPLPPNLWVNVWNILLLWIFCELVGEKLKKETLAMEQIAKVIASGCIIFDFKLSNNEIALIACRPTSDDETYRFR